MSGSWFKEFVLLTAICLLSSGCAQLSHWAHNDFLMGPDHHPPAVQIADDWIDAGNEHVLPLPPVFPEWWSALNDPAIDNLVATAVQQNLTLRQAGARVLQARANRAITAGNLLPQVQEAFGDYSHVQNSETVELPAPLRTIDEWEVGFNASWELDFWGKFRRAIESSDAQLEASVKEYDAVMVSLIAEVVAAYVDIRTFEARLDVARQNTKVQQSSFELSQNQFVEGKTSKVGVYLASANLKGTEATIPGLETGLRQANNRLCSLLSIPPSDLSELLGKGVGIPKTPADIAVGIPADLLRRRPDVRQAERLVAAQSAQLGVAIADFYPSIALNGEIYQASENFSGLAKSASNAGSIGPSFQWKILNYGRLTNNVRLQDARLLELIASYEDSVIQANREVEDALVAFLKSREQVESLQATVDDLNESLKLLLINFEEGSIDFSPVFLLQGSVRSAEDGLATAQGQVVINMINLYRALGGGWEIRCTGIASHPTAAGDPAEVLLPLESPRETIATPEAPSPNDAEAGEVDEGRVDNDSGEGDQPNRDRYPLPPPRPPATEEPNNG